MLNTGFEQFNRLQALAPAACRPKLVFIQMQDLKNQKFLRFNLKKLTWQALLIWLYLTRLVL